MTLGPMLGYAEEHRALLQVDGSMALGIVGYCWSWLIMVVSQVDSCCIILWPICHHRSPFLLEDGCPEVPRARTPLVTSDINIFRMQNHAKPFGSRSCTMDDTDGSEKLIEVLKTASHNGLIHRGELLGVCQNENTPITPNWMHFFWTKIDQSNIWHLSAENPRHVLKDMENYGKEGGGTTNWSRSGLKPDCFGCNRR